MSPWIRYVYINQTEISFYIIKILLYGLEIVIPMNETFRIMYKKTSDYIKQDL